MKNVDFKNISLKQLAAIVSKKLQEHDIDTILVGGACVSIYSQNRYQSYDLDYVIYEDLKTVSKALKELDFVKNGRYFQHKDCLYFIEFVSPPVAIGDERIHQYEYHETELGTIKMLTATDSVKDRLASYYHWDDLQGLDQAISICLKVPDKVDQKKIKSWSQKENQFKKYETFLKHLKDASKQEF